MVTELQTKHYRLKVSRLLMQLRTSLYYESGCVSYPTDSSISYLLGLSPTALSSINRQCSSMSGPTLLKLIQEISKRIKDDAFIILFRDFADS